MHGALVLLMTQKSSEHYSFTAVVEQKNASRLMGFQKESTFFRVGISSGSMLKNFRGFSSSGSTIHKPWGQWFRRDAENVRMKIILLMLEKSGRTAWDTTKTCGK